LKEVSEDMHDLIQKIKKNKKVREEGICGP
jgi:hypothetical protein